jgi:hypothetical protein
MLFPKAFWMINPGPFVWHHKLVAQKWDYSHRRQKEIEDAQQVANDEQPTARERGPAGKSQRYPGPDHGANAVLERVSNWLHAFVRFAFYLRPPAASHLFADGFMLWPSDFIK